MNSFPPLLACFSGSSGRHLMTLIYVVVGCWMATLALGTINVVLIAITGDRGFKLIHAGLFAAYALPAVAMSLHWLPDDYPFLLTITFGVPGAVGAHFLALLFARRQFRLRRQ